MNIEECFSALQQLLHGWKSKFKYTIEYAGNSHDSAPLTEEEKRTREPEYFKFRTTWSYDTQLQPVAPRFVVVEFIVYNAEV
jgi:hypothetical protein